VIADMADEVVVMYAGRVVERATAEQIFADPQHPYTQGLLRSAPVLGRRVTGRLYNIPGTVPSAHAMPKGCPFRPRCAWAFEPCTQMPEAVVVPGDREHAVRCWHVEERLRPGAEAARAD
ncbi:MAG TPA: oligopeptide/dipeptide ABC transporter ATP-binding protein, partial [Caldimonas sp.]|nr:oligopeptide/dipeptide ABC transporter ATP-binding protein [Caldimonas sp.]